MKSVEAILEQDDSVAVAETEAEGKGKEASGDSLHQLTILSSSTTKGESCVAQLENVSAVNKNDTSEDVLGKSSVSETRNIVTQEAKTDDLCVVSPDIVHSGNRIEDEFGKEKNLRSSSDEKMTSNEHHHESDVCVDVAVLKSGCTQLKINDIHTSGIQDGGSITDYAPRMEVLSLCSGSNQCTGNESKKEVASPSKKTLDAGIGICPLQSGEDGMITDDVPPCKEEKMEMKLQVMPHVAHTVGDEHPNDFIKENSEPLIGTHQENAAAEPSEKCIEQVADRLPQFSDTQETEHPRVSSEETIQRAIHSTVYPEVDAMTRDTTIQSIENDSQTSTVEQDVIDHGKKAAMASMEERECQPLQQTHVMEEPSCVEVRLTHPEVEVSLSQAAIFLENRNHTESSTLDTANVIESVSTTGLIEAEFNANEIYNIEESLPSQNAGEISKSLNKNLSEKVNVTKTCYNSMEFKEDFGQTNCETSANKECFDSEEDKCIENMQNSHNEVNAFEIGDLVWAKVRSHPWWPAQILDPRDASKSVIKLQKAGRYLVAFFGDYTFAWLQQSQLQVFKPNFEEKVKQSTMKSFCKAVNEALEELCCRSELGLACKHYKGTLCSRSIFKDTNLCSQTSVKVQTHEDVVSSINMFNTRKILNYLKDVACSPVGPWDSTLEMSELRGFAYGLRNGMIFSEWKIDCEQVQEFSFGKVMEDLTKSAKRKRKFSSLESALNECEESKKFEHKMSRTPNKLLMEENGLTEGTIAYDKEHCIDDDSIICNEKQDSVSKKVRKRKGVENKAQDDDSEAVFTPVGYQNSLSKKRKHTKNTHTACGSLSADSTIKVASKDWASKSGAPASLSDSEMFELDMIEGYDSMKLKSPQKEKWNNTKKETKGNKINKVLMFGDSMRKVASELTGALPIGKCFGKSSSKKMGSTSKKHLDSEPISKVSLMQIYEGLNNSARDPLNYSDINPQQDKTISAILKFRNEVYIESAGISEDLIVVSGENKRKSGKYESQGSDDDDAKPSKDTYHYMRKRKSDIKEDVGKKTRKSMKSDSHGKTVFGSVTSMENFTEPRQFDKNTIKYSRRSTATANDSESPSSQMELFMKFPQDYDLPSQSELNDKFMRFDSLQLSETRVDKDSATAIVFFKDGQDAETAWKYARENPMFGNIEVIYKLQCTSQSSKAEVNLSDVEESLFMHGDLSSQHGRVSNSNVSDATGNIQDRMMTLLQRVSVIVGTPPTTSDTT